MALVVAVRDGFGRRRQQLHLLEEATFRGGSFGRWKIQLQLLEELALVVGGVGYGCRSSGFAEGCR